MKRIAVSELKSNLSRHLRAAEAGEIVEVMDRARPIARVGPVPREAEEVEVIPGEQSFASVRNVRLPALGDPVSSLASLLEERGAR
jgi:antitoxin (DNA-binding transcriptional repressor) of toxin-antitoxin stability system